MSKKGFNTRLLHVVPNKKDIHGALQYPIYASSAFEFESAESIEGAFNNTQPAFAYSRSGNPTVEFFEQRIKAITKAQNVMACASGMAAATATVMALCRAGDNIIVSPKMFGNTIALFQSTMSNFGIETRFANFLKPHEVESAIDQNTRLIFTEILNNPFLEIIKIEEIAEITKRNHIPFCADTTLTPPNVFDAGEAGIDISIASSTKYISCGGSTVGGLIIDHGSFDWAQVPSLKELASTQKENAFQFRIRKEILRNTGACLSPFNAYLQSIGLETLSLRYEKMSDNAKKIAYWLSQQPLVKKVLYPALESSDYNLLCKKYFNGWGGGLLSFELDSRERCFNFMNKLQIIKRATNINDNKTLIIHPYSTIYCEFPETFLEQIQLSDTLIRLSVGIEEVDDIIDDLNQALNR